MPRASQDDSNDSGQGSSDDYAFTSIGDIRDDSDTDDEFTQNDLLHLSQDSNASPVKTPKPSETSSAKPKSVKQLNQRLTKSNLVHLWPRTYDLSLQPKIKEDDAEFIKYERDFI